MPVRTIRDKILLEFARRVSPSNMGLGFNFPELFKRVYVNSRVPSLTLIVGVSK